MSADLVDDPPVEVDRGPARLSSALATAAALLAVLTTAPLSTLALPLAVAGFATFLLALFATGSRGLLWLGSVGIFGGALVAGGIAGAPPVLVLASVAAMVLAWDLGQNAIGMGEQLGRHAVTWRAELFHAAASSVVAAVVGGVAYVVYRLGTGGQPVLALVLLLAAGVLLTWALRS
jgi:hypothetical protein